MFDVGFFFKVLLVYNKVPRLSTDVLSELSILLYFSTIVNGLNKSTIINVNEVCVFVCVRVFIHIYCT